MFTLRFLSCVGRLLPLGGTGIGRGRSTAGVMSFLGGWLLFPFAVFAASSAVGASVPTVATELRSPVNQVFQFAYSDTSPPFADGSTRKGTTYLWIPETCKKVRGLLILGTNVPEHMLVGHAALRAACAAQDLGIVWSVPTFWNFAKTAKGQEEVQVQFLEKLLAGLADVSGYAEVATVPWLPIGESGHLLMVVGLVDQRPERCIAAVCVKNPQYPKNRTVPMLFTLGTAQEWGQEKSDLRTYWNNPTGTYNNFANHEPQWPLSVLIEPATGHFYCTERMAQFIARYVTLAAQARLSSDGSPTLKPVVLDQGTVADLPVPGRELRPGKTYAQATEKERKLPWYFDAASAQEAQAIATTDWQAQTQVPSFAAVDGCTVEPFSFNSVTQVNVSTDDTFTLRGVLLDKIPEKFVGAGEPLAQTPGTPVIEWICGPVAPLGGGKFRIALDRTWKTGAACYLVVRQPGAGNVRPSLQPAMVKLSENKEGQPQKITFNPLGSVSVGTRSVPLVATSDAQLPVEFFVVAGPAIVEGGKLVLTPLPPRSKFPVKVTVAAWQWGKTSEPKVKTAELVKQDLLIVAGK